MSNDYKRILLIPCRDSRSLDTVVDLINRMMYLRKKKSTYYNIKIFIIGSKEVMEYIGRNIDKEALRKELVMLYKVLDNRDSGAEVLRLFININPDLILYVFYKRSEDKGFNAELFYNLRYSREINVASITGSDKNHSYVDYGYKLRNVEEALNLIKEVVIK